jgi:uncharacterized RDD family membrane protein YckC
LTRVEVQGEDELADLPLHDSPGKDLWEGLEAPPGGDVRIRRQGAAKDGAAGAAPLSRRVMAFIADAALVSLIVAGALLGAQLVTGHRPSVSGLPWAGMFAVYFSFFAVVLPLILFGRTLGLALAGLRVRQGANGHGLTLSEAAARWLGTLASAAALGLPLLWTARDGELPTLADRLSGRPVVGEDWPPSLS